MLILNIYGQQNYDCWVHFSSPPKERLITADSIIFHRKATFFLLCDYASNYTIMSGPLGKASNYRFQTCSISSFLAEALFPGNDLLSFFAVKTLEAEGGGLTLENVDSIIAQVTTTPFLRPYLL